MDYDIYDAKSIESYAKNLEGNALREVTDVEYDVGGGKGKLGQLVEKNYFGYEINNRQEADFIEAGIELKVCPLKSLSKNKPKSQLLREQLGLTAKERMVITIINYMDLHKETWENASLRKKLNLLLLFYLYNSGVKIDEQIFKLVSLWTPPDSDMKVIENDWRKIVNKVKLGKAHELSEGDTMYLGACTKGSTAKKSLRVQPFSDILARQRAFSLKRSYVNYILEELLQKRHHQSVTIRKRWEATTQFDSYIINEFNKLKDMSITNIIKMFSITRKRKAKNFIRLIVEDIFKHLLGLKMKDCKELQKANIEVKTIVLRPNNVPKEHMSFEQINYIEIIQEEWEDSAIRDKFENNKHFWVIFKSNVNYKKQSDVSLNDIFLYKVMFWNMPIVDLETHYYNLWKDTVKKIECGDYDNFLSSKQNPVGHIRPKAQNSKKRRITPQGTQEKIKCFWLNSKYIAQQIIENE